MACPAAHPSSAARVWKWPSTEVSRSDLQPGDLVFFQDYGYTASHVGIYIGGDQFIHASSSYYNGHCVVITSLSETYYNNHYLTARRH